MKGIVKIHRETEAIPLGGGTERRSESDSGDSRRDRSAEARSRFRSGRKYCSGSSAGRFRHRGESNAFRRCHRREG